ncbi:hypothetical protein [Aeoliella sp. SH292]|uniref:hypothetical protein n=1 Tax=Aeoliella sp. SH292 TaxID=3454464 RepID=UPI003F9EB4C9
MPIAWNTTGDFSKVVDATEPVTLLRRGSSSKSDIAVAWRFSHRSAEREPTGGYVVATEVVWQFEWPADERLPALGDRLREASGECYTILTVERTQGDTRVKCEARNLRIAHGLDCLVDIQEAIWSDEEITGWQPLRPAVHARIQPHETTVDETAEPASSTALFRVTLDDDTPLDHRHRIVGGDGVVYRVVSYAGAGRIGELPVAVVRRE